MHDTTKHHKWRSVTCSNNTVGERRCPDTILSCLFILPPPPRPRNTAPITLICCSSCCKSEIRIWTLISWCRSFTWWPLWEAFHGRRCLIREQCTRNRTPCKIPNYYVVTSSWMSSEGDPKLRHITQPLDRQTHTHTNIHSFIGSGTLDYFSVETHLTPQFFHTVTVVGTSSWFPGSHLLVLLYSVLCKHYAHQVTPPLNPFCFKIHPPKGASCASEEE